jgi:murein DD-endopeptidase MepM/ murein hydrolase activator NlpD
MVWLGIALGGAAAAAAIELPYVNWRRVVSPLDEPALVTRLDAKGDGRFLAPRSGRRHHRGIDLVAALDSPVRAIRSGTVVEVGVHRGLGRFVELEHRQHLRSVYAHLQKVLVEPGTRVRQGARIGTVGNTGNARHRWITPHLHLEVVKDGEPIDPQSLGLPIAESVASRSVTRLAGDLGHEQGGE